MVIGQSQVGNLHVAAVRYLDRVRHSVANLHTAGRVRALRHRQSRCRRFRRNSLAVIAGHGRVLRIFAVRRRRVREAARVDVALLHNIRCRHSRRLARSQRRLVQRAHDQVGHLVGYRQAAHRHVARVLHSDRVRHSVAHLHARRLVRRLRYRQLGVDIAVELESKNRAGHSEGSRKRAFTFIQRVGLTIIGSLSLILVGCADGFADGVGPSYRHGVDLLILQVLILIPEFYLIFGLVQLEIDLQDSGIIAGHRGRPVFILISVQNMSGRIVRYLVVSRYFGGRTRFCGTGST